MSIVVLQATPTWRLKDVACKNCFKRMTAFLVAKIDS